MARQRKSNRDVDDVKLSTSKKKAPKGQNGGGNNRTSPAPTPLPANSSKNFILIPVLVACLSVVAYISYSFWLEDRVISPLNLPKVVTSAGPQNSPDRYWGSYRSGHYFGMKTRNPSSPVVGLMWFAQRVVNNELLIRHWCNMDDRLQRYGWIKHDGQNFGVQELLDDNLKITTSFVKRKGGNFGGDWTARLSAVPLSSKKEMDPSVPYSFLIYMATDGEGSIAPVIQDESRLVTIAGYSESLGSFGLHFVAGSGTVVRYNFLNTVAPPGMEYLKETVLRGLTYFKSTLKGQLKVLGLKGNVFPQDEVKEGWQGNYIVHQVTVFPPFDMDIVFESESFRTRPNRLVGGIYDQELAGHLKTFENKFSDTFQLSLKGYNKEEIDIAQAALSNLLGGIGYFHGSSLVQSKYNKEPVLYWPASLYTAVPSRTTFPRGFLWDEGFHNLLINRWDDKITKEILAHWLDLLNAEGWIPREQILGQEARARVPAEFVVQNNMNGNPPTLLLTFDHLVRRMLAGEIEKDLEFLKLSFSRLEVWFNWFNTTQLGKLTGTYRWQGRNPQAFNELNPKTLTSGLDDYPRASDPTEDERHVDLRCWMAFAANVMQEIGRMIGTEWKHYADTYKYLSDNPQLERLHWSPQLESFCDYGLHSDKVKLEKKFPKGEPRGSGQGQLLRVHSTPPKLQYVNSFGYVSLFPFVLQILRPENSIVAKILNDLKNPQLLWTSYGLRSLSKTAPLYMKYNTEHDGPYWRGPIWMNLNYMVLKALNYYSEIPGPYQDEALSVYKELRQNIVHNIIKEYKRTGYLWEHYNDKTGKGEGSHPFNGWTTTFVLMMAEIY